MKYFHLDSVISETLVNNFFEFANNNQDDPWTIAIWCTGGIMSMASTILDAINTKGDDCTLILEDGYSAAFRLFYEAKCKKKIASGAKGMLHLTRAEMRIMSNQKSTDLEDACILKNFKDNDLQAELAKKIMTKEELKRFNKGEDVYFGHTRLKEIFPDAQVI